jgi:hypothetical protein
MAAPAVRSYSTKIDTGSTTSITIDKPAGTAEGDFLVMLISSDDDVTVHTTPTGWDTLFSAKVAGSQVADIYTKTAGASEPSSYTITKDSERSVVMCICMNGAAEVDVSADGTGAAVDAVCPTVTPTASDTLLLRVVTADGGTTSDPHTQATGYTLLDTISQTSGGCLSVQHKSHTTGATGTLNVTMAASEDWTGYTIAIKEAASGGGPGAILEVPTFGVFIF